MVQELGVKEGSRNESKEKPSKRMGCRTRGVNGPDSSAHEASRGIYSAMPRVGALNKNRVLCLYWIQEIMLEIMSSKKFFQTFSAPEGSRLQSTATPAYLNTEPWECLSPHSSLLKSDFGLTLYSTDQGADRLLSFSRCRDLGGELRARQRA